MSFEDYFQADCYSERAIEPLDKMLSAAWRVRPVIRANISKLANIKRAYRSGDGFYLTDDTLTWLTRLAKRGGWRPAKRQGGAACVA